MIIGQNNAVNELEVYNQAMNPEEKSKENNGNIITENILAGGENRDHMMVLDSR